MIFSDLSIKNLFATPLVIAALPADEAAALNAELVKIIMQKAEETAGVKISNYGGWQSDDKILDWGGAPVKRVLDGMNELLAQITLRQQKSDVERVNVPWRVHGWANINRKGNTNVVHCHPGAYWSAVYYVQIEEEKGEQLGGELELLDPRGVLPIMYCPELKMGIKGYVSAGTSELHSPKPGQLVIFPSWLPHAVAPYRGEGTRISLAFNFSV